MTKSTDHKLIGYGILSISSFFSICVYILNHHALAQEDAIIFALYVLTSAAVILFVYYGAKYDHHYHKKMLTAHVRNIFVVSIFAILGSLTWFLSIKLVGGTLSSLYDNITIIFSFFLGIIFLQEKINRYEIFGVILATSGAILASWQAIESNFWGVVSGISSAFFWSIFSMLVKKRCSDIPSGLLNFYRLSIMSITLFVLISIFYKIPTLPLYSLGIATISGLFGSVFAMGTYIQSHKYLPIATLNAFFALIPLFVAFFSFLFFTEVPSSKTMIGGCITIAGVLMMIKYRKHQPKHLHDGVI